jgi:hypothetical protein
VSLRLLARAKTGIGVLQPRLGKSQSVRTNRVARLNSAQGPQWNASGRARIGRYLPARNDHDRVLVFVVSAARHPYSQVTKAHKVLIERELVSADETPLAGCDGHLRNGLVRSVALVDLVPIEEDGQIGSRILDV